MIHTSLFSAILFRVCCSGWSSLDWAFHWVQFMFLIIYDLCEVQVWGFKPSSAMMSRSNHQPSSPDTISIERKCQHHCSVTYRKCRRGVHAWDWNDWTGRRVLLVHWYFGHFQSQREISARSCQEMQIQDTDSSLSSLGSWLHLERILRRATKPPG